jgi:hypothetical protein
MDPTVTAAAMPVAGSRPKKQPKARKPAKELMLDEHGKESEKRASRCEAMKNCQNTARLEEHRLETKRFLAVQALDNSEELAGKATVHPIRMIKQEAINVAFGGATYVTPPLSIGGALSASSVTSTSSWRPPTLAPNTPVVHAHALGAHDRCSAVLSQFGDLRPTSGSAWPGINLNRTS